LKMRMSRHLLNFVLKVEGLRYVNGRLLHKR
jgi:hypothetical protein